MNPKLTREMFQQAAELSVELINHFNEKDKNLNQRLLLFPLRSVTQHCQKAQALVCTKQWS